MILLSLALGAIYYKVTYIVEMVTLCRLLALSITV